MAHLDNEYPGCNDCRLCKAVNEPEDTREVRDTLLGQTDHFQWIPGLGAFVEGYSLIVCKEHVLNTGCFDADVINELERFICEIRKTLRAVYETGSVVFEHGSMGNHDYAGGCIEHQHIHILPADLPHVPSVLLSSFVNHGPVDSMKELIEFNRRHIPYMYYEPSSEERYVLEAKTLPRQYLRQVIAVEFGRPDDWDWRQKGFLGNIGAFVEKMEESRKE
ncbi:MAG: HIT family protein [Planctomycetota bacterium]|jgi:diadenosine tetraphosphate (Ap4A) HIT family hydrolase